MKISIEELKIIFDYDTEAGSLTWKVNTGKKRFIGLPAGADNGMGYKKVGIKKSIYFVHRIIWALHYGKWPSKNIDHINGNPSDNRIKNLREANQRQNSANSRNKKNKTGVRGVSINQCGNYCANITVNYKVIYLGTFKTLEEARMAYNCAAEKYFGEFRRVA